MTKHTMPIQPIENGRFVPNSIVAYLLESGPFNLNDIARDNFTKQDRIQFAQLIGYSVSGFGDLSYVDDETYAAASELSSGAESELVARNNTLREQLDEARKGVKIAVAALFPIHPDDLEEV